MANTSLNPGKRMAKLYRKIILSLITQSRHRNMTETAPKFQFCRQILVLLRGRRRCDKTNTMAGKVTMEPKLLYNVYCIFKAIVIS